MAADPLQMDRDRLPDLANPRVDRSAILPCSGTGFPLVASCLNRFTMGQLRRDPPA